MINNNNLERYWIVRKTINSDSPIIKDFDTLEECREFLNAGLKGYKTISEDERGYKDHVFWYDIVDGDCENVVLDTTTMQPYVEYVEEGEDCGVVESTADYYSSEPNFVYLNGEYKDSDIKFISQNNSKYDVVFNDDSDSNRMGFKSSYSDCMDYIMMNRCSNNSYFKDYNGGSVSIVDIETGDEVYSETVK